MNIKSWALIFTFLSLLTSCQVKESTGTGLISGHRSATNEFTIQPPAAHIYITGETLSITLTFPYAVTVNTSGGTPYLALTIGGAARNASYISGNGTTSLVFSYVIVGGDNDSDGITASSLILNGATMTFSNNGVITDCNTTITSTTYSNVLVDNTPPTITAFAITTLPGFYNVGKTISFSMTFSEAVYVTGSPSFDLTFTTGGTTQAVYSSGSGSTTLYFNYTVAPTHADTDGYIITSPINLNAGTIKDAAANNSSLNFSAFVATVQTNSATRDFDGRLPYVTSVTPPANGTYGVTQNLDFTLIFDRAVNLAGSPYLAITIGSNTRQALYLSGSGTTSLVFRYTIIPGDVDTDGVSISPSSVTQNAGNITGVAPTNSFFANILNNVLPLPSLAGILVDAVQPTPTSLNRNADSTNRYFPTTIADDTWIIGQQILITVGFNTNMYVNQIGGTPRIPITLDSGTVYAPYLTGGSGSTSLVFSYTIQEGDLDTNGITIGNIDLNGGTITDSNSTNSVLTLTGLTLTTTYIDGVRPSISSVTPPTNGTYSTLTTPNYLNFTITWSEAVNYSSTASTGVYILMTIGASAINAIYLSGNNSASIIHQRLSLSTLNDTDGITLTTPLAGTATVRDQAGNTPSSWNYTLPNTSSILVDTTAPTVSSVTPPANGVYAAGMNMDFTVTFNESVTVTAAGGYPRIPVTIGAATQYLVPTTTATGTSHTFRYTVTSGDLDSDGVLLTNSISVSGPGYVTDAALNALTGTFTLPNTTGIIVDGDPPSILSVTPPANGTYESGTNLDISLTFTESVTVTGTPRIQTTAQTGTLNFNYLSGTGTNTLVFRYTVMATDFDFDGLTSISSIDLNAGTIIGDNGLAATTTFTAINLASIYLSYPGIQVWSASSFTNQASSGGITISSAGASSTEVCGTGTCRSFDGDDTFELSLAYNNIQTLFIVFKTSAVLANYDLLLGLIGLTNDGLAFDITTVDGTLDLNGSPFSGTNHDTNLTTSSTNILQIDFTSTQNLSSGVLIPTSFPGAIGDVIIIDGALTAGQKSQILTYLNSKY